MPLLSRFSTTPGVLKPTCMALEQLALTDRKESAGRLAIEHVVRLTTSVGAMAAARGPGRWPGC